MEALFSQQRLQHTESAVVDIILWVAVLDGVLYYMCSILYQFSALYIFDSYGFLHHCVHSYIHTTVASVLRGVFSSIC